MNPRWQQGAAGKQEAPTAVLARAKTCSAVAALGCICRTMEQRYKKPADWGRIEAVAGAHGVPVVGNGDILTHYEARRRMDGHGCLAVMVGR